VWHDLADTKTSFPNSQDFLESLFPLVEKLTTLEKGLFLRTRCAF
jgi:hypothetical protein